MGLILDLAIELPVYQRSTVYVYNTNIINPDSVPDVVNPYSSPLDRIWELEFNEDAFANSGGINVGVIFAILAGMAAIAATVLAVLYISKKQSEKSPMAAYAVTISDIEAGLVRLPGEPKIKKSKKIKKASDEESESNNTEEGEKQC